jgi:molybdopterin/thiamine biosynthesis adenylyltransferase
MSAIPLIDEIAAGPFAARLSAPAPSKMAALWSYPEAFKRNRGLINDAEQEQLRNSRVAIAGMGGVGGAHLITLARMGVGKFTIADPDRFEVANFNRQYGATSANLGKNKAEAMADAVREINPEVDLKVMPVAIGEKNIDEFLDGANALVDGFDFFAIEARRLAFARAAQRGIWAATAGPIGFSTAWLLFDPRGMSFDDYFDLRDGMSHVEQVIAFAVGLVPAATHLRYTDLTTASIEDRTGPSAALACQLASGVMGAEICKVLMGRGPAHAAPRYSQFDAYLGKLKTGRLWFGNRGPIQRLKRMVMARRFAPSASRRKP